MFEVMERIYSGHWFLQSFNCHGFVHDFHRFTGKKHFTKFLGIMKSGTCLMAWDDYEFEQNANYLADKLINDNQWRKEIIRLFDNYSTLYFNAGERFRNLSFSKLSDKELTMEFRMIANLQKYHQLLGVILNGFPIDGRNHLSDSIMQELKSKISDKEKFEEYWSFLTLPTQLSLRQEKDIEIANLAQLIRDKKKSLLESEQTLFKIHKKYRWLDYLYRGPEGSLEKFRDELKSAIKDNKYYELVRETKLRESQQKKLTKKLNLSKRGIFLVELSRHIVWQKGYRKDYQAHGFWCYEPFFKELSKRKGYKLNEIPFLFPWEVEEFILNKNIKPNLSLRKEFSVFLDSDNKTEFYTGKVAKQFLKKLKLKNTKSNLDEVTGQCAYAGKVIGVVRIVHTPNEMNKVKKGDILVSQATSPDLFPAMIKAGAIVTNTGGLICHAAITARELKIPCVVGTLHATHNFKDGDIVEVNATKGVIKKVK